MFRWTSFLALLIVLVISPRVYASLGKPAVCEVDVRFEAKWDTTPRRFEVTLSYDIGESVEGKLIGPKSWGGIENFDATITNLRSTTSGVRVAAISSSEWKIVAKRKKQRVTVRYSITNGIANIDDETPVPTTEFYRNTLGKRHFQLIGHGAFVLPEPLSNYAERTACVTFSGMPASWVFASSFGAGHRNGVATYRAKGISDQLRESVFLGGDYRLIERKVGDQSLFLAVRGEWTFDDAKFADATAKLVLIHRSFWNDFNFPHYLIALTPNRVRSASYGGTRLLNAFTMHASSGFSIPGAEFDFLIGHEHLHTWMPERIGEMGENEAQYYWFSEGFTNYLTHRLLLQSGEWTLKQYADGINRTVSAYFLSPAINASNERVAREFWTDRQHVGKLPYQRGELLALRWAGQLASRGKSLTTHLRELAYTQHDLLKQRATNTSSELAVNRLTAALRKDLAKSIDGDIDRFIERGETFEISANFLGPCFEANTAEIAPYELGFDAKPSFAERKISGVITGSNAEKAGLRDGMTLIDWTLEAGRPAREASVTVDVSGVARTLRFLPAGTRLVQVPVFSVRADAATSGECKGWLAGEV